MELRPDAAVCRNNLGQVLARHGRDDEAAECYEAAIRLDPTYAEAHNNFTAEGKHQDARQHESIEKLGRGLADFLKRLS